MNSTATGIEVADEEQERVVEMQRDLLDRARPAAGIHADGRCGGGLGALLVDVDVRLMDHGPDVQGTGRMDPAEVGSASSERERHAEGDQDLVEVRPRLDPEARHRQGQVVGVATGILLVGRDAGTIHRLRDPFATDAAICLSFAEVSPFSKAGRSVGRISVIAS